MLDLGDLRAFARIADLKSISAAARALGAPKSSVSRSLARLEDAVGITLVDRSTRHLRLTDAGLLLQPHALRILAEVHEAEGAMGDLAGKPRGTLRINAPVTFAVGLIAPMLASFMAAYPDVRVVLDVENRRIDVLAEEVDLVIRIGALPDSQLVARRLPAIELWACASPAYLAARGSPASVADLSSHTLLAWIDRPTHWRFTSPSARTWITQKAELHGEAKAVHVAALGPQEQEVVRAEHVVPGHLGRLSWNGEQAGTLFGGQQGSARHGTSGG